jgi:two-component system, OmpR family, sensor histidine kinase TctE
LPRAISLRQQLLLRLLMPLMTVSIIGATSAWYLVFRLTDVVFDRELSEAAIGISQQVLEAPTADHIRKIEMGTDLLPTKRADIVFNVIDRVGKTIAGTANLPLPSEPDTPAGAGAGAGPRIRLYDAVVAGGPLRIASLRVFPGSGEDGFFQVQVGEGLNRRESLTKEILVATMPQEVLLAIFVVLAVLYGVRRGIKPLNDFARIIATRSGSDLDPLDVDAAPVEARYLVSSINDLMQRVKTVTDAQQRSAADAAHLMQTPLAGMKAQIELGQRQDISDETRRVLEHVHLGVIRLSHMLRELLVLARNDPAVRKNVQLAPIDLHQVVCDTTTEWVPIALKKGIDLGCTPCSPRVIIQGDAGRLKDLIDSLLDNAIHYTQPGGEVTVGVDSADPMTLRVLDNGPGIPIEERGHVFNRFYRVLGSGAEGSGLGLAIVKEIAELHGATVELHSGPGNIGTEVRVAFPKATIQPEAGAPIGRECALGEPA